MPGPGCADVIIICAVVSSVIVSSVTVSSVTVSRVIIFCSARRFYDTRPHPATHLGILQRILVPKPHPSRIHAASFHPLSAAKFCRKENANSGAGCGSLPGERKNAAEIGCGCSFILKRTKHVIKPKCARRQPAKCRLQSVGAEQ